MKMLWMMLAGFMGLYSFAAGEGAGENKKPVTPTPQIDTKAPHSALNTSSALLLSQARLIQTRLLNRQTVERELSELLKISGQLSGLRLRLAASFAQETAALRNTANAQDNQDRLEQQRQTMISRCNDLERLLGQIDKNRNTSLLNEKLNDLIVFLDPPKVPAEQTDVGTSRGAAAVVKGRAEKPAQEAAASVKE